MRTDEVDRGVLLVYKTRNTGYFNFRQSTHELKEMSNEAKLEYVKLLRQLASDIEDSISFEELTFNQKCLEIFNADLDYLNSVTCPPGVPLLLFEAYKSSLENVIKELKDDV